MESDLGSRWYVINSYCTCFNYVDGIPGVHHQIGAPEPRHIGSGPVLQFVEDSFSMRRAVVSVA